MLVIKYFTADCDRAPRYKFSKRSQDYSSSNTDNNDLRQDHNRAAIGVTVLVSAPTYLYLYLET